MNEKKRTKFVREKNEEAGLLKSCPLCLTPMIHNESYAYHADPSSSPRPFCILGGASFPLRNWNLRAEMIEAWNRRVPATADTERHYQRLIDHVAANSHRHSWYGPCDALGEGGSCSECDRLVQAAMQGSGVHAEQTRTDSQQPKTVSVGAECAEKMMVEMFRWLPPNYRVRDVRMSRIAELIDNVIRERGLSQERDNEPS